MHVIARPLGPLGPLLLFVVKKYLNRHNFYIVIGSFERRDNFVRRPHDSLCVIRGSSRHQGREASDRYFYTARLTVQRLSGSGGSRQSERSPVRAAETIRREFCFGASLTPGTYRQGTVMISALELRHIVESGLLPHSCTCSVNPKGSLLIKMIEPSSGRVELFVPSVFGST